MAAERRWMISFRAKGAAHTLSGQNSRKKLFPSLLLGNFQVLVTIKSFKRKARRPPVLLEFIVIFICSGSLIFSLFFITSTVISIMLIAFTVLFSHQQYYC